MDKTKETLIELEKGLDNYTKYSPFIFGYGSALIFVIAIGLAYMECYKYAICALVLAVMSANIFILSLLRLYSIYLKVVYTLVDNLLELLKNETKK